jgi:hypothetical protein
LAQASGNTGGAGHANSPAGVNFTNFILGLAHGKLTGGVGGVGGSAVSVPTLTAPHVGGSGVMQALGQAVINKVTGAANQYLGAHSATGGYPGGLPTGGGGSSTANQALGKSMLAAFGWGAGQWPYQLALWNRESGWRTNATNPSSGAYGIPQSLPAGKMASAGSDWRTNPSTQIKWGYGYEKGRYGSPQAAWAHEQSAGWYDRGGRTPSWGGWHAKGVDMTVSRPTVFGAGERGPERVQITPHGGAGHGSVQVVVKPGGIQVNGSADDAKLRRVFEKHLEAFVAKVEEELASGAEEPEAGLIR